MERHERTPGPHGSEKQWRSWWKRIGRPNGLNVEGEPVPDGPKGRWLISGRPLKGGYGSVTWYGRRSSGDDGTVSS